MKIRYLIYTLLCFTLSFPCFADEVIAAVEKNSVQLGEPFIYQITIKGDASPSVPDITNIDGFQLENLGGSSNSSSQVTIINGRMQQSVNKEYVYRYRLTPTTLGKFTIPSFNVTSSGQTLKTNPIQIQVVPAREDPNFHLRISLSKEEAFVGEPITMTVTWYLAQNVEELNYTLPIINDSRFKVTPLRTQINGIQESIKIAVAGQEVEALKGSGELNGRSYTTISFKQTVIPLVTGKLTIPQATISGNAITGYERTHDPFDDIFDSPFFGSPFSRKIVKRFVTPSNQPELLVKALPTENRPADFNGLVGEYSIITNATPTKVNVGDPITLTIQIASSDALGSVQLFPLDKIPELTKDFKIPSEMSAPKTEQNIITFTQTIRPKHDKVRAIPPISLSYFNSNKEEYVTVKSDSIPLDVTAAEVVTAANIEGLNLPSTMLETSSEGIAYNYIEPSKLLTKEDSFSSLIENKFYLMLLIVPALLFCCVLFIKLIRNAKSNLPRNTTAKLRTELLQQCKDGTDASKILSALRTYLTQKFNTDSLTELSGLPKDLQEEVAKTVQTLEAASYAGIKANDVSERVIKLVKKIDRI